MVPERGENLVRLANGTGFTVAPVTGRERLIVKEVLQKEWRQVFGLIGAFFLRNDDRLFHVTGKHPGPAKLEAKKGAVQTSLQISYRLKLSVKKRAAG